MELPGLKKWKISGNPEISRKPKLSENLEISRKPKMSENLEISENLKRSGKPKISRNPEISGNIQKYPEISGKFLYLKKSTYFKKQCPLVGNSLKKIFCCFFCF